MVYRGYDSFSKCLFSWDGDFHYEGKTDSPPSEAIELEENRNLVELIGCRFLSGSYLGYFFRAESFDKEVVAMMSPLTEPGHEMVLRMDWNIFHKSDKIRTLMNDSSHISIPACICGPAVRDPASVAEFCRLYPAHSVYVCPIVDELVAFGSLVDRLMDEKKDKPRRTSLCVLNKNVIENRDFQPFDVNLDGDGYGRMAYIVSKGIPVVNEMMTQVGISPFYGKVLSKDDGTVWIVRAEKAGTYFPKEPVSAFYAATTVPVRVRNTDLFRTNTGCEDEYVDVVIPSEYIPNLPVFMNFYQVVSGRDFVAVLDDIDSRMPVFRFDRGYSGAPC